MTGRLDGPVPSRLKKVAVALSMSIVAALSCTHMATAQWTVTLIKHNNKAVEAYNSGYWDQARNEFRTAIGINPNMPDFYEGLMNTCVNAQQWEQVAYAAEKLVQLDPTKRNAVAYAYGMALFKLNRDEQAVPWLKRALATVDQPDMTYKPQIRSEEDIPKSDAIPVAVAPVQPITPKEDGIKYRPPETANPEKYNTSFENAIHSESIVIAEYEGYDKHADIRYNNPMRADYHIVKILKGPPLNRKLPIKYEFHDHMNTVLPQGWKFGEGMMPKKGSQWLLFIEYAVPKKGEFETFEGSYGRQEASEENLAKVDALLDKYNMRVLQAQ